MQFENILVEKKENIAIVTINRPKVLNALSTKTFLELAEAFGALRDDASVAVVILTGAGEKAFVAGADISEFSTFTPDDARDYGRLGWRTMLLIEKLGKPVIAAINGFALGGGLELAMSCTFRYAADNAKMGQPEVNLGLTPGFGGTQRLPRLVGKGRALEMLLTGKPIDAATAERIGLVNKVVPQAELLAECEKTAKTIAAKAPIAIRYCIEAANSGLNMSLEEAFEFEAGVFGLAFSTEDFKEGIKAFTEKREAKFKGK
ncbi:MAG: enoyl-CoA hydratase-related protein [Candidatus Eisenbacteria bacterium]